MVETWYSNGPDFKWDLKTGATKSDFLPVKSKMVALSTDLQMFPVFDGSDFRSLLYMILTVVLYCSLFWVKIQQKITIQILTPTYFYFYALNKLL